MISRALILALMICPKWGAAEGLMLTAAPQVCAVLEAAAFNGLTDRGSGGEANEFMTAIYSGDPEICMNELRMRGLSVGINDPDCMTAFDILASTGLPEGMESEMLVYLKSVVDPATPEVCDEMLSQLTKE